MIKTLVGGRQGLKMKALLAKPDNLNLITRTHMVEGENQA